MQHQSHCDPRHSGGCDCVEPPMADDLTEIKQRIAKAREEIGEIAAQGSHRRFRMSLPAQPDRDSDLLISRALKDAEDLAAEVERLRAETEASGNRRLGAVAEWSLRAKRAEALVEQLCEDRSYTALAELGACESRLNRAEAERDEARQVLSEEITAIAQERIATRRTDVIELIHERDALKAATERVRALHPQHSDRFGSWCGTCHVAWPCPTLAALDHPTDTTGETP